MEGGVNPRHPTTWSSDDHVHIDDHIELSDLTRKVSAGDAIAMKHVSHSGVANDTVPVVQTKSQRLRARLQFATLCWTLYLAGWNDGTTGPLLPRIQEVYNVNFAVVSLIFVFACVGFVTGAFSNVVLNDRYGFGKVIVFGSVLQVIGYAIESAALPFPAFVLGYAINGIGLALQDAQANGFVASLKDNAETKMGILHAVSCVASGCRAHAYHVQGAGALSSPLVATQFAQLPHWSFHYLTLLGIALINTVLLVAVFRLKRQDECLAEIGYPAGEQSESENSHFRQIFALKDVHLLAMFILVYVGVEVTLGGWIVTYVINVRGGGPSSGYISSGFFGGLMMGRVALLWLNRKVGERRVLFIYALLAIGLQLVVWFVPSLIGGAVAVSIIGVLLGPMYPITMNHAGRVLPAWLLTGNVSRRNLYEGPGTDAGYGRFDWMDRWFRSSGVSTGAFYDGRNRIQGGYQLFATLVSSDDGVHDGPLGARSQQGLKAYGLMTRYDNVTDHVSDMESSDYT
ncbi:major facilitator superfamily domain-containing protein [Boletus reticuloceps]|uniref:Major facilitator superfamily domain-containing protein n=1 Tax=Boletus reticuloceps TaxID=495285 RepID=A0A8I2YSK5_9AGAM|nr:major facilitator superfamily domain-containing protein [Boletus reticuloceps]